MAESGAHSATGASGFVSYPVYKDSGVEWLGEIPAHWEVGRLKNTVTKCRNGVWGKEPDGMNDIACIRVADFDRRTFAVRSSHLTLRSVDPQTVAAHRLRAGDLLLEKSGGGKRQPVGVVVVFSHDVRAVCSNFIARMPVHPGHSSRFLVYLHARLYSTRVTVRSIKQSIGIQNLDGDSYLNKPVGLPPLSEQQAIADFLDRETAKIDGLVAKQRELMDRLQEKRTSLTSHAVTKGLDPDASMQDSGVEWLGEIPAHWEVGRLKSTVTKCQNGVWGQEPDGRNDIACVRVADFSRRAFCVHSSHLTLRSVDPKAVAAHRLRAGDLLLEKSGGGERQPVGVVVVFSHDVCAVCSNFIARMPVHPGHSSRFLVYLHARLYSTRVTVRSIKQSIGIQNLDGDSYLNEPVGLPPLSEQQAIADHLDHETAKIDALTGKITKSIDLLDEYRAALISAAVTGKIDVRDHLAAIPTPPPSTKQTP